MACEWCTDHWECGDDDVELCEPQAEWTKIGRFCFFWFCFGVYRRTDKDKQCVIAIVPYRRWPWRFAALDALRVKEAPDAQRMFDEEEMEFFDEKGRFARRPELPTS